MGEATSATGIQFRMLQHSKGPALWSPRAQCDKAEYAQWMKERLEATANCHLIQGEAWEIATRAHSDAGAAAAVGGVALRDGRTLSAPRVVVTTGTFLRGLMHQGATTSAGGRMGDQAAQGLSGSFERLGLRLLRHKTGTPCRLRGLSNT